MKEIYCLVGCDDNIWSDSDDNMWFDSIDSLLAHYSEILDRNEDWMAVVDVVKFVQTSTIKVEYDALLGSYDCKRVEEVKA